MQRKHRVAAILVIYCFVQGERVDIRGGMCGAFELLLGIFTNALFREMGLFIQIIESLQI